MSAWGLAAWGGGVATHVAQSHALDSARRDCGAPRP